MNRLLRALGLDLRMAWQHLVLVRLAGSAVLPRPVRWLVYRAAGLDVRTMNVFPGVRITGRDLHVGTGTFVNHDCYLDVARGRIEIGARCHLAPQVMILTASHDLADGRASATEEYTTTHVGDDVWLGARATVLPGVRVGNGCVVAAGAVVTEDCAPGGLYAGVPARLVRRLTPREVKAS